MIVYYLLKSKVKVGAKPHEKIEESIKVVYIK